MQNIWGLWEVDFSLKFVDYSVQQPQANQAELVIEERRKKK